MDRPLEPNRPHGSAAGAVTGLSRHARPQTNAGLAWVRAAADSPWVVVRLQVLVWPSAQAPGCVGHQAWRRCWDGERAGARRLLGHSPTRGSV